VQFKTAPPKQVSLFRPPPLDPKVPAQGRQRALEDIQKLKAELQINPGAGNNLNPSPEPCEKTPPISTNPFEN
jgi:hypothetical protein